MLTRFRKFAYIMAYAVATIPLWHYIRDGRILALMVAVVTFAYVIVVLSTVEAAQPILSSEKAKTPLPRWLPAKPKYQKWWMLVRHTLKWHLLLVVPKMGLALGFTQWLYLTGFFKGYFFHELFDYIGYNVSNPIHIYPQWETLLIAFTFITLFTLAEAYFLSSLVLLTKAGKWIVRSVAVRLLASLCFISLVFLLRTFSNVQYISTYGITPCSYYHSYTGLDYDRIQNECIRIMTFETTYMAMITPFEQGILFSANIMRPISQLTMEQRGYGGMSSDKKDLEQSTWDNRPFVARQIVAGMLGLLLYAGATWVVLWFVEDEVVRE